MSDVADMLGLAGGAGGAGGGGTMMAGSKSTSDLQSLLGTDKKAPSANLFKMKKPKGMSREVFGLMNADSLTSAMQSASVTINSSFQKKRVSALKGKWVWVPFSATNAQTHAHSHAHPHNPNAMAVDDADPNSVSALEAPFLSHWVRAEEQYPEYPYSKFNVKLENVTYTDEEYEMLLSNTPTHWTRSETDHLMQLVYQYDLRWPVIADRYALTPLRSCEDLQERFYSILSILKVHRTTSSTAAGGGTSSSAASSSAAAAGSTGASSSSGAAAVGSSSAPATSSTSSSSSSGLTKAVEPSTIFNIETERARRNQLDLQFKK
jgi:hypothetical protein